MLPEEALEFIENGRFVVIRLLHFAFVEHLFWFQLNYFVCLICGVGFHEVE